MIYFLGVQLPDHASTNERNLDILKQLVELSNETLAGNYQNINNLSQYCNECLIVPCKTNLGACVCCPKIVSFALTY